MAKPFKVGFIGAGGIALMHMQYLKKIDGVGIAAASDVSAAALERARDEYAIPSIYADHREMLKKEADLDAISVCTPNGLHARNTIDALEAGKHVMVEKPMAMSATEAQSMNDAAKRANKKLIVGFQYRFDPKSRMIHDQISSGAFGKVMYVRCQALRRRGIPNWGVFGRKDLQGGGPMIDIGVHVLEMAHYMIGSPNPVSATGNTWTFFGNKPSDTSCMWPNWDHKTYSVEDMAAGMVRFDNGAILTIEASFVAHIEKDIWNVNVMCEKGGANWETGQIFADYAKQQMNMTPGHVDRPDIFEAKMRHFVDVCRDGKENVSPGEHGMMVQKMLDGVYASAEKGREVEIA
ncbi:MAG: Gfo/Idh/MocA family protein [Tepidisphaeraceae bacterium]